MKYILFLTSAQSLQIQNTSVFINRDFAMKHI
jgi:hypothetical protein